MNQNILLDADSYKYSQFLQLPPGTTQLYSYIESRGGALGKTLMFAPQYYTKEYLSKPFNRHDINEAEEIIVPHGEPFNREGFEYILNKHGGYFPLHIRAVKEGTVVPTKNVLMDIINTDEKCAWCTDWIETQALRAIWYGTTVASREYQILKLIYKYLVMTADPAALDWIGVKHNDFGLRGASSKETAMIGGMAHLTCFTGTDNVPALVGARDYYGAVKVAGYSIPASQHSTMTSWGLRPGEVKAMRNMVKTFGKPGSILACVSDSYDLWNAIENYWCGELLQQVKDSGAVVVVRPDSGDPIETPVKAIKLMMEKVGFTTNSKGYKMLPPYFRVIQGDGIDLPVINSILIRLAAEKISTDNIAFGMGGAMLQKVDRDTQKFAMKASSITVDGELRDVFKDPITDPGKTSKKGRLDLLSTPDGYKTVVLPHGWEDRSFSVMETIYYNGEIRRDQKLEDIRKMVMNQVVAGV